MSPVPPPQQRRLRRSPGSDPPRPARRQDAAAAAEEAAGDDPELQGWRAHGAALADGGGDDAEAPDAAEAAAAAAAQGLALKQAGNAAFARGDFDEAAARFTEALALGGADRALKCVLHSNRSACHASGPAPDPAAAVADAQECLALDPGFAKGYSRLGTAHLLRGDAAGLALARAAFEAGLAQHPGNPILLGGLASCEAAEAKAGAETPQEEPSSPPPANLAPSLLHPLPAEAGDGDAEGAEEEVTVEPVTKHAYPTRISVPGAGQQHLAGVGVRYKQVLVVKLTVYSVAVYLDLGTSRAAALDASRPLGPQLAAAPGVDLTVAITIHSDLVTTARFLEHFDERLLGPMRAAGEGAVYADLRAGLGGLALHAGARFLLRVGAGGTVLTGEDGAGRRVARVASATVCRVVKGIYLGADPVAPSLAEAVEEGAKRLL